MNIDVTGNEIWFHGYRIAGIFENIVPPSILDEFIDISHKFPNNAFKLFAYNNKADFEYIRGKIGSAMKIIDSLIGESKRMGNIYYIITALKEQAEYLFLQGKYDESLKFYNESLEYAKDFTPI